MSYLRCACHLIKWTLLSGVLGSAACVGLEAGEYLVSDRLTNQVLRYQTEDGSFLGAFVDDNLTTNGGLFSPTALTFGFGDDLYVTSIDLNVGDGRVLRYDGESGAYEGVFASGMMPPGGILYHEPSDTMLVGSLGATGLGDSSLIARFAADGTRLPDIDVGPVTGRTGMLTLSNGDLLVSSFADSAFFSGAVLKYTYDSAADSFALDGTFASAPELLGANGLALDPSGDLWVASLFGQSVLKFDVESGVVQGSSVLANIAYPSGLLIDADGNLLVTSLGNNNPGDPIYGDALFPGSVFKLDPTDGSTIGMGPFLTLDSEFQPTAIVRRPVTGDYNRDGLLTAVDIDALTVAVNAGSTETRYDLNGDGRVDSADRAVWVEQLKETYFGDANLDGEFGSADLVEVLAAGEYEDSLAGNSTWATGDWDGDTEFESADLILALQGGGFETGPRPASIAVPEPTGGWLLWLAAPIWAVWGRSRLNG